MSCFDYDDPDRRVVALNRRARLLHDIAHNPTVLPSLRGPLHEEALAVADEAALLVAWYGAKHGEAYYHGQYEGEDPEQLCEGWAVPDGEVAVPKVKTVPVKDEAL